MRRTRTAVLLSGRGSNMAALAGAARDASFPAEIVLVLADKHVEGVARAKALGLDAIVVDRTAYPSREAHEVAINAVLREARVELACLAGYMRLLSAGFVEAWRDRILNIHPALLPAFPGLRTHERALEAGVRIHGATVHVVRAEVDAGPILCQAAVPVRVGDNAETLAARVLAVEHIIYPQALAWIVSGVARLEGERVVLGQPIRHKHTFLISPEIDTS